MPFGFIPSALLSDPDALSALKRDWNLRAVIYDPCTFILENSACAMRDSESDADRRFRAARRKEKRELQTELAAARG